MVCKDTNSLKAVRVHDTGNQYNLKMNYLVSETDRLIEYILAADRNVLHELLTTNECVVRARPTIKEERSFNTYNDATSLSFYNNTVTRYTKRLKQKGVIGIEDIERPIFIREYWASTCVTGPSPWEMVTFPATERCGILTQPSWLIAHADAMENHLNTLPDHRCESHPSSEKDQRVRFPQIRIRGADEHRHLLYVVLPD